MVKEPEAKPRSKRRYDHTIWFKADERTRRLLVELVDKLQLPRVGGRNILIERMVLAYAKSQGLDVTEKK